MGRCVRGECPERMSFVRWQRYSLIQWVSTYTFAVKARFPLLRNARNVRNARNASNARFYAKNATYARSDQWRGCNLSRDMACVKSESSVLLRWVLWTLRKLRCLRKPWAKPCVTYVACLRLENSALGIHSFHCQFTYEIHGWYD